MDAAKLLAEAQAISPSSSRIKAFCLDTAAALAEFDTRLKALENPVLPTPTTIRAAQLPLMLG